MGRDWTMEGVLALAPDPASAKAGKGMASPGKWVLLGRNDSAIWGLIKGSGSDPYQVRVETEEPAYRCSCPSRKFPCKHAIGLFLVLAEHPGALKNGEPPAWVSAWLEKRGQKKETAERPKKPAKPADPAEKAERDARRRERIQQGLAELERRLGDIVRGGLASALNQNYSFWDETARRLVDAQAPGIARRARELGEFTANDPRWAERLLGKMGRLKLLIEGWRRIDGMRPDEQWELRSAAGWPVSKDEVLAGAGVSDLWRVMAVTLEEDDQSHIRTQRVWLWGARTRRAALLLEFAHRTQPLSWLLPPGNSFEAELVYFPGAGPRALIRERRESSAESESLTGYDSFAEALDAYAAEMEICPWLDAFPMLVEGLTPAFERGEWYWVDLAGETVPVGMPDRLGWKYLAEGGGAPMQVFGEWTGNYFMPLPKEMNFDCASSARKDLAVPVLGELARSIMLESSRQSLANTFPEGAFKDFIGKIEGEDAVLKVAGTIEAGARMGRVAVPYVGKKPEQAPVESLRAATVKPSAMLARMLEGEHEILVEEWLALAAEHRRIVRPDLLPGLLTKGEREADLRESIARAGGERSKWLGSFRPEWRWTARAGTEELDPDVRRWEEGDRQERVSYLRKLREQDPARARETLAAGFAREAAPERQAFLAELRNGLSAEDEIFLNSALEDRSSGVRQIAAELLSALPGSELAGRMGDRLAACVRFNKKLLGKSTTIEAPETLDERAAADGITEKAPARSGFGEKGGWLAQIVGLTPLDVWTEASGGMDPEAILASMVKSEWWNEVTWGLIRAAKLQESSKWGAALLNHKKVEWQDEKLEMFGRLPAQRRLELAAEALKNEKKESEAVELLKSCPRPWPIELSRLALGLMRRVAGKKGMGDWTLAAVFVDFAAAMARGVLAESVDGWDREAAAFKYLTGKSENFLSVLQTRKTMIEVFRDE